MLVRRLGTDLREHCELELEKLGIFHVAKAPAVTDHRVLFLRLVGTTPFKAPKFVGAKVIGAVVDRSRHEGPGDAEELGRHFRYERIRPARAELPRPSWRPFQLAFILLNLAGIVDLTTMEAGAEGLAAVEQLAADLRAWADLPTRDLEIFLFSLGAFIEKAGTGGGLFRRLLADGCADVARLTGDLATADLAVAASRCAQAWTETARAGTQRDIDARARLAAVVTAASRLPELESNLVESLELASTSLTAAGL